MSDLPIYPLRFAPIFQGRIWGGRRLADLFPWTLPGAGPIGEAWVLSDRDDHPSRVANGPLAGRTIHELFQEAPQAFLGRQAKDQRRFPLLLKFLDARDTLSVQVHPTDRHTHFLPPGERGKTEAWVVLQAEPGSKIYAGVRPGTTAAAMQQALEKRELAEQLPWFAPKPGDGVFLPAGTLHALGGGVVIFEVQQNSDVTFRLYDWDRVDAVTGEPRQLHIEQALACTDFARGPSGPVTPTVEATTPVRREQLFSCEFFLLWRLHGNQPVTLGAQDECRVLVGLRGQLQIDYSRGSETLRAGDVMLLPAALGSCDCRPASSEEFMLLEIALPK